MLITILKKLRQQIVLLLAVSLVLLAAYVSIGRQFMPAVAGYTEFFEEQFLLRVGVPVTVESLSGGFQGFNPIIGANGLSLMIDDNQDTADSSGQALRLGSATVVLDVPRSIWQRQLVIENIVIDNVAINIVQNEAGEWSLQGLNFEGGGNADLNDAFQLIQRFARLSLTNVSIHTQSRDGDEFSLSNGSATIRNLGLTHQIHINANPDNGVQQIAISLEIEGNEIDTASGRLHVDIPESNYSSLFSGVEIANISVQQVTGGGDLWLALENGQLSGAVAEVKMPSITLIAAGAEPFTLNRLAGKSVLEKNEQSETWRLALADMSVSWQELNWAPFNMYLEFEPGESLLARADTIDLSLLARVAVDSGILSAELQTQLEDYSPRGSLENFDLYLPLSASSDGPLSLQTNVVNIDVASVGGVPTMWGINGYVEASYDPVNRLATGFADLESESFSINIPSLFTRTWDYNYVNGRIGFHVDLSNGTDVKIVSGALVANSDAVDGRAVFTSTLHQPLEGETSADFELLVGASRVDATQKSLYLPDSPMVEEGLRNTMQWLDRAILDGELYDSGVVYRGSTVVGAAAVTKTFQSFFLLADGELEFSDEWPQLQGIDALILTDDSNIDVEVNSGQSMGMEMSQVTAAVRPDADQRSWLSINGQARGSTAAGLAYLQVAPVNQQFRDSLANWEAQGEFSAGINVRLPFNQPGTSTDVRLEIELTDNQLSIPDYALDLSAVSGLVIFDTSSGLEPSELTAELFDRPVQLALSSQFSNAELEVINVEAAGSVDPARLIEWPLHSSFARDLLRRMDGEMNYVASIALPQGVAAGNSTLLLESDLRGARLSLPQPLSKSADSVMPLRLNISFGEIEQDIEGYMGSDLNFNLKVANGFMRSGVVYAGTGTPDGNLRSLLNSRTEGVAILGAVKRLELSEWTDFLGGLTTASNPAQGVEEAIAFVDIRTDVFELYGEELPAMDIRIEPAPDRPFWEVGLTSEAMLGQVNIPFDSSDYTELKLEHLRLPREEEEILPALEAESLESDVAETQVAEIAVADSEIAAAELIDVMADIDPRELPPMRFDIADFSIGSRPFGSWKFQLDPTSEGADISDLRFDFRGLRLGLDAVEADVQPPQADSEVAQEDDTVVNVAATAPRFRWLYDGREHHSMLDGVLYADDIGQVLTANGYTASLESSSAVFDVSLDWPGSPAFFAADGLSGNMTLEIGYGRFLQGSGATGALKLISIINFNAIMRRLRLSNDLTQSGLAFDEINGEMLLEDGVVTIQDRLVISGPSSLYQITGKLDLAAESIDGEMYLTLPVSDNIPWIGLLTANLPLAVGAYLFDRIFGSSGIDSLTSAVYTLQGPWEDLEPQFKQAFGSPGDAQEDAAAVQ